MRKITMAKSPSLSKRSIFRPFNPCLALAVAFAISLCLITQYSLYRSSTFSQLEKHLPIIFSEERNDGRIADLNVHQTVDSRNLTRVHKNLYRALFNSFVSATRVNHSSNNLSACVVDPAVTDCYNLGFAAFLLLTLELISVCRALGSTSQPTVIWRACVQAGCSNDSRINSWEMYFEPVNPGIISKASKVLCVNYAVVEAISPNRFNNGQGLEVLSILNSSFRNRSSVKGFEVNRIITLEERYRVNQLMRQYVKPNARIRGKVKEFYQKHLAGYNVLAVHIRGTDHWDETETRKLPAMSEWTTSAAFILESLPHPRKIFVASDNNEVIIKFVTHFGKDLITFTKALRAQDYKGVPPHKERKGQVDPQELGSQVLLDILLMAKCDHFLHAESSVASLASYFNPSTKTHFLYDVIEFTMSRQESVHHITSSRVSEMGRATSLPANDDDDDVISGFFECFEKNSPGSACPHTAQGVFVNLTEAMQFLR